MSDTELDKAWALAELGVHVFPVRHKKPLTPDGFYDASTDRAVIESWWTSYPDALVGYWTGASGLCVLDIDYSEARSKSGYRTLDSLELPFSSPVMYTTPGGGAHYVFKAPENPPGPAAPISGLPDLDRRSGNSYGIWYGDVPPSLSALPPAPEWMVQSASYLLNSGQVRVFKGDVSAFERWLGDDPAGFFVEQTIEAIQTETHIGHDALGSYMRSIRDMRADLYEPGCAHALAALRQQFYATTNDPDPDREWERWMRWTIGEDWEPVEIGAPLRTWALQHRLDAQRSAEDDGLTVLSLSDLLSRPEPEWWVEGLFQESTIAVFAGVTGIGKSFMMLHLAGCVAAGAPFFGRPVKQGKVLYVVAEGAASFGKRAVAFQNYHGVTIPEQNIGFVESGVNLTDPESMVQVNRALVKHEPDIIILDTLSQLASVQSENDAAELANVFRTARHMREVRPGSTVIVVHHVNKASGTLRGSSAIKSNVDTVVMMTGEPESSTITTDFTKDGKQKDGEPVTMEGFKLESHLDAAVLVHTGVSTQGQDKVWLAVLGLLRDGQKHPSADVKAVTGLSKNPAATRLAGYVNDGLIFVEGQSSRMQYWINPTLL